MLHSYPNHQQGLRGSGLISLLNRQPPSSNRSVPADTLGLGDRYKDIPGLRDIENAERSRSGGYGSIARTTVPRIGRFFRDAFVDDIKSKGRIASDVVSRISGSDRRFASRGDYVDQSIAGAASLVTGGLASAFFRPLRRAILRSPVGKPFRKQLYKKAILEGSPIHDAVALGKFLGLKSEESVKLLRQVYRHDIHVTSNMDNMIKGYASYVPSSSVPLDIRDIAKQVGKKTHAPKMEFFDVVPSKKKTDRITRGFAFDQFKYGSTKGSYREEAIRILNRAGNQDIESSIRDALRMGRPVSHGLRGQTLNSAIWDHAGAGVDVGGAAGRMAGRKATLYDIYDFGPDFAKSRFPAGTLRGQHFAAGDMLSVNPLTGRKSLRNLLTPDGRQRMQGLLGLQLLDDAGKPFVTMRSLDINPSLMDNIIKGAKNKNKNYGAAAYRQWADKIGK